MTTSGQLVAWAIVLGVLVVSAPLSWWAALRTNSRLMAATKPLPMLALIAGVAMLPWQGLLSLAVLLALVFGLVGDVALLEPLPGRSPGRFGLPLGLGAFLLGHLSYLVAVLLAPRAALPFPWPAVPAALAAAVIAGTVGRGLARSAGTLRLPVAVYEAVILALAIAAAARGPWLLLLGAALFVTSDLLLGWSLFRSRRPWHAPAVMVTYHLAQLLLVVGLLTQQG